MIMTHLPKSEFVSYLITENQLNVCGFARFVFFDGMMCGAKKKWWGEKGLRESLHEGLDLCFFENAQCETFRLDETVNVPMLYDGRVVHITDDFLGKTVITHHCFKDPDQSPVLSLYGHLNPDKNLKIGDEIKQGQSFAKIAGFEKKQKILLPHLHISLAKPDLLPPANSLEWEFLNTVDRNVFIDPLSAIAAKYTIIEYDDSVDVTKIFTRCSGFKSTKR